MNRKNICLLVNGGRLWSGMTSSIITLSVSSVRLSLFSFFFILRLSLERWRCLPRQLLVAAEQPDTSSKDWWKLRDVEIHQRGTLKKINVATCKSEVNKLSWCGRMRKRWDGECSSNHVELPFSYNPFTTAELFIAWKVKPLPRQIGLGLNLKHQAAVLIHLNPPSVRLMQTRRSDAWPSCNWIVKLNKPFN